MAEALHCEADVRAAFRQQGEWCDRLGSPFMARLMTGLGDALDRSTQTGARVLGWQGQPDALGDAVALRLAGALHDMVRRGGDAELADVYPPHDLPETGVLAEAAMAAIALNDAAILPWLDLHPQTNEVARSGILYPGLMTVAERTGLPLDLFEVGASAGLNLMMDRYAYDFAGMVCGASGSRVALAPEWSGPLLPAGSVQVASRLGCDRQPIDLGDDAQRARVMAYVWPDQPERLARTTAAIDIARADLPRIDAADAADWVEQELLVEDDAGTCRVLFHSIAFQYFPEPAKKRIRQHMEIAGRAASGDAPLAWLSFEQHGEDGPRLTLRLWPGGEEQVLAHADAHVRWVHWL